MEPEDSSAAAARRSAAVDVRKTSEFLVGIAGITGIAGIVGTLLAMVLTAVAAVAEASVVPFCLASLSFFHAKSRSAEADAIFSMLITWAKVITLGNHLVLFTQSLYVHTF